VPIEQNQNRQGPSLRQESRHWVNASIPRQRRFDWRELVIKTMNYTGALNLARRISKSLEIRPDFATAWPLFRRVQNSKFLILCYHGIGESGNPLSSAPSPECFEAQMRFLRRNYRVVSLEEVCRELRSTSVSEPGIAITFDDGYRSAYTVAFSILQKYRLPATVYLTYDSVETDEVAWYDRAFLAMALTPGGELNLDLEGPLRFHLETPEERLRAALEVVAHLRTLPDSRRRDCCALLEKSVKLPRDALANRILTWEQVRTMQRAGITFGSHTLTHPVVSQLAPAELERELADSMRLLEGKLESPVLDFAFPFGKASDCSLAAIEVLSRCGYRSAVTTVAGVNTSQVNPYELRRLQVRPDGSLARFAFDVSRALLQVEEPRALNVLARDPSCAQQDQSPKEIGAAFGGHDA
jgi:peptidoglycan/xylan/chitin deacetylase (PgdA/CDA1 family)